MQHWHFVAITAHEDKRRLMRVAYGQQLVLDSAVTFIVLGDIRAHELLGGILERSVKAVVMERKSADAWIKMANRLYQDPQMARDEAMRSSSLAAMTLMLAAEAKGLVTAPMVGFDQNGLKREFQISERYIPVMLLAVGYPVQRPGMRKERFHVDEILTFYPGREFPIEEAGGIL